MLHFTMVMQNSVAQLGLLHALNAWDDTDAKPQSDANMPFNPAPLTHTIH